MAEDRRLTSNPFLNFDKMSENSKIIIGLPDKKQVISFVSDNISFGGSAAYTDFADSGLSLAADAIKGGLRGYGGSSGARGKAMSTLAAMAGPAERLMSNMMRMNQQYNDSTIPEMKVRTLNSTALTWSQSPLFTITIPMTFVAFREDLDVKAPVRELVKCTYPILRSSFILEAPNRYNATESRAISLSIGKWLKIPKYLLIQSANFYFSKETLKNGSPLYASGQVAFTAYRVIPADTIGQFLKDGTAEGLPEDYSYQERTLFSK